MIDIHRLLEESGSLRQGHFRLSSGLHSPDYVQCALLLERPDRARAVAAALAERLAPHEPASILSPALGGVIIGHEVAAALGVPFRFAERKDGELTIRRGFELPAGERLAIVEDVVTTGRSTRETIDLARAAGGDVVAVGSIINRSGDPDVFGMPFESLLALALITHEPDDCPLCADGAPLNKPGSR